VRSAFSDRLSWLDLRFNDDGNKAGVILVLARRSGSMGFEQLFIPKSIFSSHSEEN